MKRLFIFALTSAMSLSAQATQWRQFTSTMYVLDPAENQQVVAMASLFEGEQIVMNLVDMTGSFCREGQNSAVMPAGPYKVNGTNVKFVQACINGKRILSPETVKGKAFLAKAITAGPATVELEGSILLHFSSEDFQSAKKAMVDTNSAL
ncbi:hypothetical protein HP062_09745 [Pseudomonas sp. B14-6]|uniref:hypothetical protein n=1 Tax=Pseudomonas TaxID=286 RepID=UPI0009F1F314|nr:MULTISPECIES: hypothetical protein [Pseudomonas]MDF9880119.1 hypothetical protein [Pseudomonas silensiensis]QKG65841.1 hypothetical protein HP062_09745 [Pseudomonas sp. B14-6]TWS08665.1 hypothetical protein FJD35_19465 [Pseudomonas mandelii]